MIWVTVRIDVGRYGSRGSFPWQCWPFDGASRQMVIRDQQGDVVCEIHGVPREQALAIGKLLEDVSWAMCDAQASHTRCKNIVRAMSTGRVELWGRADGGGRTWWQRLLRR